MNSHSHTYATIGEALIVGTYSLLIYVCSVALIWTVGMLDSVPWWLIVFKAGFLKHFIGYFALHSSYCTYGAACKALVTRKSTAVTIPIYMLIAESIVEGAAFVVLVYLLQAGLSKIKINIKGKAQANTNANVYVDVEVTVSSVAFLVFVSGFILHTVCELVGIHKHFCRTRCR